MRAIVRADCRTRGREKVRGWMGCDRRIQAARFANSADRTPGGASWEEIEHRENKTSPICSALISRWTETCTGGFTFTIHVPNLGDA